MFIFEKSQKWWIFAKNSSKWSVESWNYFQCKIRVWGQITNLGSFRVKFRQFYIRFLWIKVHLPQHYYWWKNYWPMRMIITYLEPVTKFIQNLFYLSENEKSRSQLPEISISDLEKTIYKPTLIPINFLHKNIKLNLWLRTIVSEKLFSGLRPWPKISLRGQRGPNFFEYW